MIYEAKYSGRAYYEAMADASEWADGDGYYRSPCGHRGVDGFDFRCGCTGERDGSPCSPEASDIADCSVVRWLSCGGNLSEYRFDHGRREVVFYFRGARHGHNFKRLAGGYIWQEPQEVIQYETQTPHWQWWETLDDHASERLAMTEKFGWPEAEAASA